MKLSAHSYSLIESALEEAMKGFASVGNEQTLITDIHLQPKQISGELSIYDDNDNELSHVIVEEWVDYDNPDFYQATERILRNVLAKKKEAGLFENLSILAPYSFVLVDEEHETVSELMLMGDDILLVHEELLKGVDEELDDFLKQLLDI